MRAFIAEYDLDRPARALHGLGGYEQGLLVVRKCGEPFDFLWVPHDPGLSWISGRRIRELIRERLEMGPAMRIPSSSFGAPLPEPFPEISVVVCTRDRARSLRRCLASLARLVPPAGEVIVVDNASRTGETREAVAETPFRYVREERPGLDWARNRGAREARHGIVAYLDDDAVADPAWLRGIARGFAAPEVAAVTGLVLPEEMETRPQHLFETYGGMGKGMKARAFRAADMTPAERLRAQDLGVGANMAFRRSFLEEAAGFDTALDVGTPSCGAGDLDMFQRVILSGRVLRYEPSALVRHRHRRDMGGLRRQLGCNGRAYGVYLIRNWMEGRIGRRHIAGFVLLRWLPWLGGRILLRLLGLHRLPASLLWAELRGAIGSPLAYVRTYRHDRNLRRYMI